MTSTFNPAPVTSYISGNPQEQNGACSSYLARIKRTAIMQLVGGCVLVALGIVAIILLAVWSYFATAIWSGILIFGVTGVIGILAGNNGNKCLIRTYLVMSIFGCLMGLALFHMHIFAAIFEDYWGYWQNDWVCQPGKYYYSWIDDCAKSEAARETFDALISITGFFLFVVCIFSASFGCCASCKGCESCCKTLCGCNGSGCSQCCTPAPQPITAIYQPQGPTVATPGHQQVHAQAGMYIVQQGQAPVIQYPQVAMPMPATTNQGQAAYYVVPPATQAPPPLQSIPVHMHPQQPNPVAPPTYYVAGQDNAAFPPVELPDSKA